jgi:hypothetical protein
MRLNLDTVVLTQVSEALSYDWKTLEDYNHTTQRISECKNNMHNYTLDFTLLFKIYNKLEF